MFVQVQWALYWCTTSPTRSPLTVCRTGVPRSRLTRGRTLRWSWLGINATWTTNEWSPTSAADSWPTSWVSLLCSGEVTPEKKENKSTKMKRKYKIFGFNFMLNREIDLFHFAKLKWFILYFNFKSSKFVYKFFWCCGHLRFYDDHKFSVLNLRQTWSNVGYLSIKNLVKFMMFDFSSFSLKTHFLIKFYKAFQHDFKSKNITIFFSYSIII